MHLFLPVELCNAYNFRQNMNDSLLHIATDCSMDSRDNQETKFDISFKDLLQI